MSSTAKARFDLTQRLAKLGFAYDEATALRRISMTLSAWSVAECNGEIQRDDETGKPFRVYGYRANGTHQSYPITDREAGALRRLDAIMANHKSLWSYYQGDPRGCSLYVGRKSDLPKMDAETIARCEGENAAKTAASRLRATIRQYYHNGVAVCA